MPLCPHVAVGKTLALPPEAAVRLKGPLSHEAMLNLYGKVESPLRSGDKNKAEVKLYMVRFSRVQPKTYFYSSLRSKLKGKIS